MTIKDIIMDAARILGDETLYAALADTETALSTENQAKVDALLKCYNDVSFEIAAEYFPLTFEESVSSGKIAFSTLTKTPLKIKSVRGQGGADVTFTVGQNYLETEKFASPITVVYDYIPDEKALTDNFDYENTPVGKTIFCYGIAAEYCIIGGRYSEASNWESKFKNAVLNAIQPRKRAGNVTPKKVWI